MNMKIYSYVLKGIFVYPNWDCHQNFVDTFLEILFEFLKKEFYLLIIQSFIYVCIQQDWVL